MHPLTFSARYFPRASRSAVLSMVRAVVARALGPMNGRHPIVNVMPAANITASRASIAPRVFPGFFIVSGDPVPHFVRTENPLIH